MKFNKYVLAVITIVVLSLGISLFQLSTPGLHYDEALFINAALGGKMSGFIAWKVRGITLFVMAYIGGLKSLLYAPIFAIFGVSYETIRLPVIILAFVSIIIFTWFLYKQYNKNTSLLYLFFSLLNPSIIFQSRLDIGPSVIEFVIIQACLALFILYHKTHKLIYLLILPIFFTIGAYNKLNFIWIANAFVAVIFLTSWKTFFTYVKKKQFLKLLALFVAFALPYLLFIFVSIKFNVSNTYSVDAVTSTILLKTQNLITTITGTGFIRFHFVDISFIADLVIIAVLCLLFAGIANKLRTEKFVDAVIEKMKKPTITEALLLVILFIFAQILITKQAIATWHTAQVLVFWNVLLSLLLASSLNKKVTQFGLVALATIWIGLSGYTLYGFMNPKIVVWTPTINELSAYTKSSPTKVKILDWSIYNQLIAFDYVPGKYSEEFWDLDQLSDAQLDMYVAKNYQPQENIEFVYMFESYQIQDSTVRRVERSLAKLNYKFENVKTLRNGDKTIYVIVKITKKD